MALGTWWGQVTCPGFQSEDGASNGWMGHPGIGFLLSRALCILLPSRSNLWRDEKKSLIGTLCFLLVVGMGWAEGTAVKYQVKGFRSELDVALNAPLTDSVGNEKQKR